MTQLGMILGTAAYMAPEQARGKAVDKRSDIWAFGCVLFEMLTGTRAFDGEDATDTIAAVVRAEPKWDALPSDVPEPIRLLLRRCLEKDRKKRIGDISTALFLLTEPAVIETPTTSVAVTPPQRRSRTRLWIVSAALLGAAAVSPVVWMLKPAAIPASLSRFSVGLPDGQTFTGVSRHFVAVSKDGTRLAYVANSRLYLRTMSDLDARPIAGTDGAVGVLNPVFSPDGGSLAFFSVTDGSIKRIPVTGGAPQTLCQAASPLGMSWDGGSILFSQGVFEEGRGTIQRISENGGTPETLLTVKEGELAVHPQMLPGGDAVLFTLVQSTLPVSERWQKAEIVIQSLKDDRRTALVTGADGRYLPTGHLVYALGGVVFAAPFDLSGRKLTGASAPVIEGVRRSPFGNASGAAQFGVSEGGTLVYVPGPTSFLTAERALFVSDSNGSRTQLAVPPGPYLHPRVSHDGKYLAVATDDGKDADVSIYDLSATSAMRRITFGGRNLFPIWSPDGRIAFQSNRDGDAAIFTQRADGSGVTRLTKPEKDVSHIPESWSPDGRTLLFSALKDRRYMLFALSLAGGQINRFGDVESAEPIGAIFSPNGRWVAYTTNDRAGGAVTRNRGVYVQPFPATGTRIQAPKDRADFHPTWGPTGDEIFFIPTASRLVRVGVETQPDFDFVGVSAVPSVTVDRISTDVRDYDVLPDGRFVGTAAAEESGSGTARTPQIRVVLNWQEELKRLVPTR